MARRSRALVFRREIGAPLYTSSPTQLMGKRIREHNDALPKGATPLPRIRFHDLRQTLRTNAHVLADQAAEVATLFASLVDTADEGPRDAHC